MALDFWQAAKFGQDYQDKLSEFNRLKAKEEARREEEATRRREELYGIRRKREEQQRQALAGDEDMEVEDLGAEVRRRVESGGRGKGGKASGD